MMKTIILIAALFTFLLAGLLTSGRGSIQIQLKPNSGQVLDSHHEVTVSIRNNGDVPVTLYSLGSSWGDPTIWFELSDSMGHKAKAPNEVMAYFKNGMSFYTIAPGEVKEQRLQLYLPGWTRGFSDATRGLKGSVMVRAALEESGKTFQFPRGSRIQLWNGLALSNSVPLRR